MNFTSELRNLLDAKGATGDIVVLRDYLEDNAAAILELVEAADDYMEWGAMTSSDRQIFANRFSVALAKLNGEKT